MHAHDAICYSRSTTLPGQHPTCFTNWQRWFTPHPSRIEQLQRTVKLEGFTKGDGWYWRPGLMTPSRVHRARGCDLTGNNAKGRAAKSQSQHSVLRITPGQRVG